MTRTARLKARWREVCHRAALGQAAILLSVFYWVAVAPIGLARRVLGIRPFATPPRLRAAPFRAVFPMQSNSPLVTATGQFPVSRWFRRSRYRESVAPSLEGAASRVPSGEAWSRNGSGSVPAPRAGRRRRIAKRTKVFCGFAHVHLHAKPLCLKSIGCRNRQDAAQL